MSRWTRRPVTAEELAGRLIRWLNAEAALHPAEVEAAHHRGYAELNEDGKRLWRERFGSRVAIEVTDERIARFLAENPDIQRRGLG